MIRLHKALALAALMALPVTGLSQQTIPIIFDTDFAMPRRMTGSP